MTMRLRFVPTPDNKYILIIDRINPQRWDTYKANDMPSGPWEAVLIFHEEVEIE